MKITAEDIKFPKKITVGTCLYYVKTDITIDGGSFDTLNCKLVIGTRSLEKDPGYVWGVINHELMEMVYAAYTVRYDDRSVEGNYKFFMDHKEFSNCSQEFSKLILKFIKKK